MSQRDHAIRVEWCGGTDAVTRGHACGPRAVVRELSEAGAMQD